MQKLSQKPEVPNVLFQYRRPTKRARRYLSQSILYANAPANFNDPYDCGFPPLFSPLMTREEYIDVCEKIQKISGSPRYKIMSSTSAGIKKFNDILKRWHAVVRHHGMGISCFSERKDNLLMWSHYAEHGEGFCLAFDTRKDPNVFGEDGRKVMPVVYSAELPKPDIYKFYMDGTNKPYMELFSRKPREWKYEKEWRIFTLTEATNEKEREKQREIKYDPGALKAVYFGDKIHWETKEHICSIVEKKYPHAKCYEGKLSDSKYKVEFDRIR